MSDFQSILDKKNKDFYDKLCIENFKILDVDTIKLCIKKIIILNKKQNYKNQDMKITKIHY